MSRRLLRSVRYPIVGYVAIVAVLALATTSLAQVNQPIIPTPTPQPTPHSTPQPTISPAPPDEPSPTPAMPSHVPLPGTTTPTPKPTTTPKGSSPPTPTPTATSDENKLPADLQMTEVRTTPFSGGRDTVKLVKELEPLTQLGVPLQQILIQGMGRVPVAGLAFWTDDWLAPRFTPVPHLHHGLDLFADFGTPIRAPDRGVITSLSDDAGGGGIGVWMRGSDGTAYYFAHMLQHADGLAVGQSVQIGTVLGFVGNTGNAQGGPPHLHFEVHPNGGGPVPPKPFVDKWLDEAEQIAPKWVAAELARVHGKPVQPKRVAASDVQNVVKPPSDIEASMLLTLLDPIGGSVGLLPKLDLAPQQRGGVSDSLVAELIRERIEGYLLVPSQSGIRQSD